MALHVFDILLIALALAWSTAAFVSHRQDGLVRRQARLRQWHAMKTLPDDVVNYSQVPAGNQTFTATSIPQGLRKNHSTKAGTWGVIRVLQGNLGYQIEDEPEITLDPMTPGVIEPQVLHHVAPRSDDVEFVVEFYRYPDTGPVDEPREGIM